MLADVPSGAVRFTKSNGEPGYYIRAPYSNGVYLGKAIGNNLIPFGGDEIRLDSNLPVEVWKLEKIMYIMNNDSLLAAFDSQ